MIALPRLKSLARYEKSGVRAISFHHSSRLPCLRFAAARQRLSLGVGLAEKYGAV